MDLIPRYLYAVKLWLPMEQQDDILAELTEDLRSQIDEREAELGRKLDGNEIAAILKKRGQPMLVASGYLPRRQLIGACWFPIYSFVLKLVLLWIMPPIFALIVTPVIYFTAPNPGSALLDMVGRLPVVALITFAIITLVFACLERYQVQAQAKTLDNWDPRKLPPVPVATATQEVPRATCVAGLVGGILWTSGWVYLTWFHPSFDFGAITLTLAPVWRNAFWPILIFLLSGFVASLIGFLRPSWTRFHSSLRLLIDGYCLILLGLVFKAGTWIEITSSKLPAARVLEAVRGTEIGLRIAFAIIAIVCVIGLLQEAHRIFRVKTQRPWTANGWSAS